MEFPEPWSAWIDWVRLHPPMLAWAVLLGSLLAAKLVDIVLCRLLRRLTERTMNTQDDIVNQIVASLRRRC